MSEHRTFGNKIRFILGVLDMCWQIPDTTITSLPIESNSTITINRKRFLCPQNSRGKRRKKSAPQRKNESKRKYAIRMRRAQRNEYFQRKSSQRIFRLRSQSVEPFNEWFKSTFELKERVWHRGIDNNRTQVLTCYLHIKY